MRLKLQPKKRRKSTKDGQWRPRFVLCRAARMVDGSRALIVFARVERRWTNAGGYCWIYRDRGSTEERGGFPGGA